MANGTWKIARNKGSAQLPLAIVAILAVAFALVGKAQSGLLDGMRTGLTDWGAPVIRLVNGPFDGVSQWFRHLDEMLDVYHENIRLKEENARLKQWRSAALLLESRVKRYQLLMNAVPDPALTSTTARVIGRATKPFIETMILDAGKSEGVKPGQAVMDARGVVGRIYLAGQHTAWVILLTDLNSRIPVTVEPGNVQAIMAGDNSQAPSIDPMTQGVALQNGAQVVTSGDGGLLPPGLPIGTLVEDNGQFRVALLADPGSAEDVQILDYKAPPGNAPSPTPQDLPATAAGLAPKAPLPNAPTPNAPAPNATAAQQPVPHVVVPSSATKPPQPEDANEAPETGGGIQD
jgi:rod shape-determining protein MreC